MVWERGLSLFFKIVFFLVFPVSFVHLSKRRPLLHFVPLWKISCPHTCDLSSSPRVWETVLVRTLLINTAPSGHNSQWRECNQKLASTTGHSSVGILSLGSADFLGGNCVLWTAGFLIANLASSLQVPVAPHSLQKWQTLPNVPAEQIVPRWEPFLNRLRTFRIALLMRGTHGHSEIPHNWRTWQNALDRLPGLKHHPLALHLGTVPEYVEWGHVYKCVQRSLLLCSQPYKYPIVSANGHRGFLGADAFHLGYWWRRQWWWG